MYYSDKKTYKVDFHSHSILSHDGGISEDEYVSIILSGRLDCVAVTDHNEIDFALYISQKYPGKFIVGEEISTQSGDLIGLFLKERIERDLSVKETALQIHEQGGIVYLPHPLDPLRSGIKQKDIQDNLEYFDIIELYNPRYLFPLGNDRAKRLVQKYSDKVCAVSSDSHSAGEVGFTYTELSDMPTAENLIDLLKNATFKRDYLLFKHIFTPKLNKMRKKRS